MRLALAAAVLLFACKDPKDFPPLGGGPGGVAGQPDALPDTLDAPTDANLVTGRVCVVQDLRKLTICDAAGAADIEVQIGTRIAATDPDGTFTIDLPSGTGLTWQLVHPDFVTSVAQLSSSFVIPMIRLDDFANLLSDNGIILDPLQGSIVVQVLANDLPLPGATAAATPMAQFPTRYDGNSALTWDQDATSAFGVAWLPGMSGTSASLKVTSTSGTSLTTTVPVQSSSITFATVGF